MLLSCFSLETVAAFRAQIMRHTATNAFGSLLSNLTATDHRPTGRGLDESFPGHTGPGQGPGRSGRRQRRGPHYMTLPVSARELCQIPELDVLESTAEKVKTPSSQATPAAGRVTGQVTGRVMVDLFNTPTRPIGETEGEKNSAVMTSEGQEEEETKDEGTEDELSKYDTLLLVSSHFYGPCWLKYWLSIFFCFFRHREILSDISCYSVP